MIYTTITAKDIEIVKDELESKAKEAGFGLLHTYEFKQILESKGFPIEKDMTVFELCDPSGAQQALKHSSEISVYLPCRISVYEENGSTTLSTIGLEEIVSKFNKDTEFTAFMNLLFINLKKVMHSWSN